MKDSVKIPSDKKRFSVCWGDRSTANGTGSKDWRAESTKLL